MPYGVQNMNDFTGFKRNNIPDSALDGEINNYIYLWSTHNPKCDIVSQFTGLVP